MSRLQKWSAVAVLVAYATFVIVFRETAGNALSTMLQWIGHLL
jgi:hypothetical protein